MHRISDTDVQVALDKHDVKVKENVGGLCGSPRKRATERERESTPKRRTEARASQLEEMV